MARRRGRGKAEGTGDRIMGRALELFAKVTGRRSAAVAGKAARTRGRGRATKGRMKRRSRGRVKRGRA